MALCETCNNIIFSDLPPFPDWLPVYDRPIIDEDLVPFIPKLNDNAQDQARVLGVAHHRTLYDLQKAAHDCKLCQMIYSGVKKVIQLLEEANQDEEYVSFDKSGGPTCELWICSRKKHEDGFIVLSPAKNNDTVYLMSAVGFCVEIGSQFANRLLGRPVQPDPKSDGVLDRIQDWIKSCDETHDHIKPQNVLLPSRVIDVGDIHMANRVKLWESNGAVGQYASLSHCWGSSRQLLTTKASIHNHKLGIDISNLPQTLRDAVFITRKLGLRFLWLDTLCICQDDRKDWERESSRMADIYAGAFVTIAAVRGTSDITGFLSERAPRTYVSLPYSTDGVTGTVLASSIPLSHAADSSKYVEMPEEPLSTRAWALQERYLSPRTIFFGTSQLSFECRSHFFTEDGYRHPGPSFNSGSLDNFEDADSSLHRGYASWANLVFLYTQRKLSIPSDKLPAFGGIARLFEEHRKSSPAHESSPLYLAGLWSENLIEDLCWQCIGGRGISLPDYRAPSWSWASIDGEIAMTGIADYHDIARVQSVRVDLLGENPYGEVKGGQLRLNAPLERAWTVSKSHSDVENQNLNLRIDELNDFGYPTVWDVRSDASSTTLSGMELFLLPLCWSFETEGEEATRDKMAIALVVQGEEVKVDSNELTRRFRRRGCSFVSDTDLIDKWMLMTERETCPNIIIV